MGLENKLVGRVVEEADRAEKVHEREGRVEVAELFVAVRELRALYARREEFQRSRTSRVIGRSVNGPRWTDE